MLKRTITGLLLLSMLLLILYVTSFTQFAFDGLVLIISILALYEMYEAMKKANYNANIFSLIVLVIIIYPLCYFYGYIGLLYSFLISFFIAFIVFIFNTKTAFNDFLVTVFLMIYPTLLLALCYILAGKYGMIPILFAIGAALMSDTIAYFGGSLFGKKKIFPKISPKKTYAGSILGLFGGALGGIVVYLLFEVAHFPTNIVFTFNSVSNYPYLYYIVIGIIIAVFSQMGDLGASRIKRQVGLKDYGTIFGSHGGVMDRIDSILFGIIIITAVMVLLFK